MRLSYRPGKYKRVNYAFGRHLPNATAIPRMGNYGTLLSTLHMVNIEIRTENPRFYVNGHGSIPEMFVSTRTLLINIRLQ